MSLYLSGYVIKSFSRILWTVFTYPHRLSSVDLTISTSIRCVSYFFLSLLTIFSFFYLFSQRNYLISLGTLLMLIWNQSAISRLVALPLSFMSAMSSKLLKNHLESSQFARGKGSAICIGMYCSSTSSFFSSSHVPFAVAYSFITSTLFITFHNPPFQPVMWGQRFLSNGNRLSW